MLKNPRFIFWIPKTDLKLEAQKENNLWTLILYYAGQKEHATTIERNLSDKQLIHCLKLFFGPEIYKNKKSTKKNLSKLIHSNLSSYDRKPSNSDSRQRSRCPSKRS